MNLGEEIDQFQLLEEKVEGLIQSLGILKREKTELADKARIQEERIADLSRQVETLKATRDQAKQRIVSLLERIDQLEL